MESQGSWWHERGILSCLYSRGRKGDGEVSARLGYGTRHIDQEQFQQVGRGRRKNILTNNTANTKKATRMGESKNINDKVRMSRERQGDTGFVYTWVTECLEFNV